MPQDAAAPKPYWIYLLIVGLLAPSFFWILQDYHVWPWDQAWYGEVSVDLWYSFTHSPYQWIDTLADGLDMKPPGVVWFGHFFLLLNGILGSPERSLLFSILATQFVLLLFLFRSGQAIAPSSPLVGIAGVVFAASGQLSAGMSRQYFVEPLQAVAVAWTLLVAIKAPEWSKARIAVHLAGAFTLGLLAKATTPVYGLLPCLYCVFVVVRRPADNSLPAEWRQRSFRLLAIVIACSVFVVAVWYMRHLSDVWRHVRDSTSGDVALNYATPGSSFDRLKIWIQLVKQSFLYPYLGWAMPPALLGAAIWIWKGHRLPGMPAAIVGIAALQTALLLWVFAINTTVEPRYMYAILPYLAVLFMWVGASLPRPAVLVLLAVCVLQWGVVSSASLGEPNQLADQSVWFSAPHRDRSQYDELTRVVRLTSSVAGRYNIVAVEEPHLNANSASFFAAKERLNTGIRSYYTSLGYAQKNTAAGMQRIEEFRTRYVITLAEPFQRVPPDFLNVVSLPTLQWMRRDARFTQQEFPAQTGVLLFRFNPGFDAK